jgi:hypothetical protein
MKANATDKLTMTSLRKYKIFKFDYNYFVNTVRYEGSDVVPL